MVNEEVAFRATLMAGKFLRDGNTERSRIVAEKLLSGFDVPEGEPPLQNGEAVFAVSTLLATCMTRLSVHERMIVAVSCGNVALELAKGIDEYEAAQAKAEGAPT